LLTAGAAASAALLLPLAPAAQAAAAGQTGSSPGVTRGGGFGDSPDPGALQRAFAAAATEYRVPLSVLLGVSYLSSRWDGHAGVASVTGGYGPMHLTQVASGLALVDHHSQGTEDPRGDTARPAAPPRAPAASAKVLPERLRTLDRAAELTGLPAADLRGDTAANVRGGAALLAAEQRRLGLPLSSDPARWYAAVAAYPRSDDAASAAVFADDVYDVIRGGARRTTSEGQEVSLDAAPDIAPETGQLQRLGLPNPARDPHIEAPPDVSCEWVPAPYQDLGNGDYGNYD
jgi:hypothetical protein